MPPSQAPLIPDKQCARAALLTVCITPWRLWLHKADGAPVRRRDHKQLRPPARLIEADEAGSRRPTAAAARALPGSSPGTAAAEVGTV
jgi:hypothetical protein